MLINITIEVPQVELLVSNRYGKLYRTSEGYHINGDKAKFIALLERDLHSGDCIAEVCAANALAFIADNDEV